MARHVTIRHRDNVRTSGKQKAGVLLLSLQTHSVSLIDHFKAGLPYVKKRYT